MEQVLSSTTTIFIDQKAGNNLIYLPLDKLVPMGETAGAVPYVPPLTEADAAGAARGGATSRGRADLRSRGATP
jgi:membrane protease subunit HflK